MFSNRRFPMLLYWIKTATLKSQGQLSLLSRAHNQDFKSSDAPPSFHSRSTNRLHTGMTSHDLHLQNDRNSELHFLRWSSSYPSRLWQAILRLGFFLRGHRIHHPCCTTCTLSTQLLCTAFILSAPAWTCLSFSWFPKAGRTKLWKNSTKPDSCSEGEARSRD